MKLTILWAFLILLPNLFIAQTVVFSENFNLPSGPDSISNGYNGAGNPTLGDTTDLLSVLQGHSYHIKGSTVGTEVFFQTDAFSTIGFDFIKLEFAQIAKLYNANFGYIQLSTDSGTTWHSVDNLHYRGDDASFPITNYFNQASYNNQGGGLWLPGFPNVIPNNSWWRQEEFDLTGLANDTTNSSAVQGYQNVIIRFVAQFNSGIPAGNSNFSAGWFIDELKVIGANCELIAPKLTFDYTPGNCYVVNPSGFVPRITSNNYKIGIHASDKKPLDSGLDSVTCFYRVNGGPLQSKNMLPILPQALEHSTTISGVMVGDTVDYAIMAWDLSCPNASRLPSQSGEFYRFIPVYFPGKCIPTLCGASDLITEFPWHEGFESKNWISGFGSGDIGTTHRGSMPSPPIGIWNTQPNLGTTIGWSVNSGATGTLNTGPSNDHTSGAGKYLYTEFSQKTGSGPVAAWVETPCIDLRDSITRAFQFYYHMYGADIENLRIDIDTGDNGISYWNAYDRIKGSKQNASNEEWKSHFFSLEKFLGKIIKVRFTSIATSGELRDLAIDDLMIFEPPTRDAALIDLLEPNTHPCADTTTMSVKAIIQNQGLDTIRELQIAYQLNGGTIHTDSISNVSLALGDSMTFNFNTFGLNINSGINTIQVWLNYPGDVGAENDTITTSWISNLGNGIIQFPHVLDFESSYIINGKVELADSSWILDSIDDNASFTLVEGILNNTLEGPLAGLGNNQKALALLDNNPTGPTYASFRSRCINLASLSSPRLTFNYYLKSGVTLKVRVQSPEGNWQDIRTLTGFSSPKSDFSQEQVSLNGLGDDILIQFSVENQSNFDLTNAVIIDNILIGEQTQDDIGIYSTNSVLRRLSAGTTVLPTFQLGLYASKYPMNYAGTTLNVSFKPVCDTSLATRTGQATHGFNFSMISLNRNIFNLTLDGPLEKGRFTAYVWLDYPGDSLSYNDTIKIDCIVWENETAPYLNTMDKCEPDFFTNGTMRQWEIDTPTVVSGSSGLAYVTNSDTSLLSYNGPEVLLAPFFEGLDTLVDVELRIKHRFNFPGSVNNQFGTVQYFDGSNWQNLAVPGYFGQNWVQNMSMNSNYGLAFNGNSGGWINSTYPLDPTTQPGVNAYRFITESNPGIATEWEIDEFEIYVPEQHSASPLELQFSTIIPADKNEVSVKISNTGRIPLSSVVINIEKSGGTLIGRDTINMGNLDFGQSSLHTLSDSLILSPGINILKIYTSYPNNRMDEITSDDTITLSVNNLQLVDSIDICTDFESEEFLTSYNIRGAIDSNWQYTSPTKPLLNGAFSGSHVWITRDSGDYLPLTDASLFTPQFKLKAQQCYRLSFWHWHETEYNFDGGVVLVSLDSDASWSPVGDFGDSAWYNTPYVQAFGGFTPGFSGSSGGWVYSFIDFHSFYDVTARFRFRFASGASVQDEGWMIDDLCVEEISGWCNQVQQEEYLVETPGLNLYPNPATDVLFLEHSNLSYNQGMLDLQIYSAVGELVLNMMAAETERNVYAVDISSLAPGAYFVRTQIEGQSMKAVFVKE